MDNPFRAPEANLIGPEEDYAPLKLFTFSGRLGRLRYLLYSLLVTLAMAFVMGIVMGVMVAVTGMPARDAEGGMPPAMTIAYVLTLIPVVILSVMFGIRRLHDMNLSGWFILVMLIPFVSAIFYLVLLLWPGTPGPNRFGPPPPPNSTGIKIGAVLVTLLVILGIVAVIALPAYQQYLQRAAEAGSVGGVWLEWAVSRV